METRIPAPNYRSKQTKQRTYTRCTHRWGRALAVSQNSKIPVIMRQHSHHALGFAKKMTQMAITSSGALSAATGGVDISKRRLGFSTVKRNGNMSRSPAGQTFCDKGCNAEGLEPCTVTGCVSPVRRHRKMFERLSSPQEEFQELKKIPVKTYWIRTGKKEQDENQPSRPTKLKSRIQGNRNAVFKNEVRDQGSVGRRIRPALAGVFDLEPAMNIPEKNDTDGKPPPYTDGLADTSELPYETNPDATRAAQTPSAVEKKNIVISPERARELEILRQLEEVRLTSPVFACAGPRSMNDYSEGPLTLTYFGDPKGEEPKGAGIREWVKGTLRSLRVTGPIIEEKTWELPRGWLEEGE